MAPLFGSHWMFDPSAILAFVQRRNNGRGFMPSIFFTRFDRHAPFRDPTGLSLSASFRRIGWLGRGDMGPAFIYLGGSFIFDPVLETLPEMGFRRNDRHGLPDGPFFTPSLAMVSQSDAGYAFPFVFLVGTGAFGEGLR